MTREEFENSTFEECMNELYKNNLEIVTLSFLKEFAKLNIDESRYTLAIHILEALDKADNSEWWHYDYAMGTLDTPTPLKDKDDIRSEIGYLIDL